jgi:hypothetical protein
MQEPGLSVVKKLIPHLYENTPALVLAIPHPQLLSCSLGGAEHGSYEGRIS